MRFEDFRRKKTTLAGFEPARENPMDFKSIALTTRPQCLANNLVFDMPFNDSIFINVALTFKMIFLIYLPTS
jgi:hypothetical protein